MKKINLLLLIYAFLFFGILTVKAQSLSVSATVLGNVSCYGGSNGSIFAYTSGGTTPYTYLWSPGSQTNQTASNLSASTYTVQVTDLLGNTSSSSATISQPAALTIAASAKYAAVCAGMPDSLYSFGTGGVTPYRYNWTGSLGDISCPTCLNTNSYPYGAVYLVTAVFDYNGCTATASVSVTVHTPPLVSIAGPINPIAPGRSDTLVASVVGSATYLWSNSSTTSSIIVSPSVSTTYSVTVTNMFGCYDTAHYTIDTNSVGNGASSSSPIRIVPSASVTTGSYSTLDSVVWFSFIPTDSNNQIIATSAYLGLPVPHVHRLTLYDNSLNMLVDEPMPDITGANQIRIDISHLHPGSSYLVRASRCPAHANMAGCNPSGAGECNASQRWNFQMCFRTVPVFVPQDSGSEAPSTNQLYYEDRGQIIDLNGIPRFDIKAYTNFAVPAVYASDSAVSFVYSHADSTADTMQRVDMVLAGSSVLPSQPVFKMEEDSGAGYLNYYKEFIANGAPKIEGYSRLVYKNIYSNIDMHVYSNTAGTKLYFVCNPTVGTTSGGNPTDIELEFKGATSINTTGGALNVVTGLGTLSFAPGYAYTDSAGIIKPKSWQAYFISVNSNTVRFNTGAFNSNEPLVIEVDRGHLTPPGAIGNIMWSTYVGSSNSGINNDEFMDTYVFNTYSWVAGDCSEPYFPVTIGVVDTVYKGGFSGYDAVVAKFDNESYPPGQLEWATYYGGSGDDQAYSVTTDVDLNVYVTGYTNSNDFPVYSPAGAYRQLFNQGAAGYNDDAFILKLNGSATVANWSTYFGGTEGEIGHHLTLCGTAGDTAEYLYVVGGQETYENTSTIPTYTVAGAYNSTTGVAWIAKFNVTIGGTFPFGKILWSTDIGSNGPNAASDALFGCCTDGYGNLWVAGQVSQGGFDIVNDSHGGNSTYSHGFDGIVAKIDGLTNNIDFSTYYGGDGDDICKSIASDGYNVFITGSTTSPYSYSNTPIPLVNPNHGYYQNTNNVGVGGQTSFIAEFSNPGTLEWSTYYGGTDPCVGNGIAYESNCDDIYIVGTVYGGSLPFPASEPVGAYNNTSYVVGNGTEGFIASFNTGYCAYLWGTYFGGTDGDNTALNAVSCDAVPDVDVVIAGSSGSTDIPVYNAFQSKNYGGMDACVADFDPSSICIVSGIDNTTVPIGEIMVYPNPTANNIMVQTKLLQKENVEFILYNAMGQTVSDNILSAEEGSLNHEMDLSLLPNGIYLLKVDVQMDPSGKGNKYFTKKIVKQN